MSHTLDREKSGFAPGEPKKKSDDDGDGGTGTKFFRGSPGTVVRTEEGEVAVGTGFSERSQPIRLRRGASRREVKRARERAREQREQEITRQRQKEQREAVRQQRKTDDAATSEVLEPTKTPARKVVVSRFGAADVPASATVDPKFFSNIAPPTGEEKAGEIVRRTRREAEIFRRGGVEPSIELLGARAVEVERARRRRKARQEQQVSQVIAGIELGTQVREEREGRRQQQQEPVSFPDTRPSAERLGRTPGGAISVDPFAFRASDPLGPLRRGRFAVSQQLIAGSQAAQRLGERIGRSARRTAEDIPRFESERSVRFFTPSSSTLVDVDPGAVSRNVARTFGNIPRDVTLAVGGAFSAPFTVGGKLAEASLLTPDLRSRKASLQESFPILEDTGTKVKTGLVNIAKGGATIATTKPEVFVTEFTRDFLLPGAVAGRARRVLQRPQVFDVKAKGADVLAGRTTVSAEELAKLSRAARRPGVGPPPVVVEGQRFGLEFSIVQPRISDVVRLSKKQRQKPLPSGVLAEGASDVVVLPKGKPQPGAVVGGAAGRGVPLESQFTPLELDVRRLVQGERVRTPLRGLAGRARASQEQGLQLARAQAGFGGGGVRVQDISPFVSFEGVAPRELLTRLENFLPANLGATLGARRGKVGRLDVFGTGIPKRRPREKPSFALRREPGSPLLDALSEAPLFSRQQRQAQFVTRSGAVVNLKVFDLPRKGQDFATFFQQGTLRFTGAKRLDQTSPFPLPKRRRRVDKLKFLEKQQTEELFKFLDDPLALGSLERLLSARQRTKAAREAAKTPFAFLRSGGREGQTPRLPPTTRQRRGGVGSLPSAAAQQQRQQKKLEAAKTVFRLTAPSPQAARQFPLILPSAAAAPRSVVFPPQATAEQRQQLLGIPSRFSDSLLSPQRIRQEALGGLLPVSTLRRREPQQPVASAAAAAQRSDSTAFRQFSRARAREAVRVRPAQFAEPAVRLDALSGQRQRITPITSVSLRQIPRQTTTTRGGFGFRMREPFKTPRRVPFFDFQFEDPRRPPSGRQFAVPSRRLAFTPSLAAILGERRGFPRPIAGRGTAGTFPGLFGAQERPIPPRRSRRRRKDDDDFGLVDLSAVIGTSRRKKRKGMRGSGR